MGLYVSNKGRNYSVFEGRKRKRKRSKTPCPTFQLRGEKRAVQKLAGGDVMENTTQKEKGRSLKGKAVFIKRSRKSTVSGDMINTRREVRLEATLLPSTQSA